ncbi:MAG: nucleotidyltransferase [Phycisphaerales bacterium]|nr:nucleotidyltransferase [Phycisphaerales bacterium]
MDSILELLIRLRDAQVEFVVVGGLAATLHGSAVVTEDVDVCAPLSESNLSRIVDALRDLNPRHRMTPGKVALTLDVKSLAGFKNLYLTTDEGQLDILSEISGVGDATSVRDNSVEMMIRGCAIRVLSIDSLIRAKKALGRPKDIQTAIELEALRSRLGGGS